MQCFFTLRGKTDMYLLFKEIGDDNGNNKKINKKYPTRVVLFHPDHHFQ